MRPTLNRFIFFKSCPARLSLVPRKNGHNFVPLLKLKHSLLPIDFRREYALKEGAKPSTESIKNPGDAFFFDYEPRFMPKIKAEADDPWATKFLHRYYWIWPKRKAQLIAGHVYERTRERAVNLQVRRALGKLDGDFKEYFTLANLHIWMMYCRFRKEGRLGDKIMTQLFELWWIDVEDIMAKVGVPGVLFNSTLSQFQKAYNGACLAYDEGCTRDDTVLADAIWRLVNLLKQKLYSAKT